MRLSALASDVTQLLSVTEIMLPQTFLCVDRSSIQYDFHGGTNALWHSVNQKFHTSVSDIYRASDISRGRGAAKFR